MFLVLKYARTFTNFNMKNNFLFLALILIQFESYLLQEKISPCPKVFTYDTNNDSADSWHGTIKLSTNVVLHGISIDVLFDRRVPVFGAYYFEDITTRNNEEYHIENKNHKLNPSETLLVNFYVKYNQYENNVPLLKQIRLNGQNICINLPKVPTTKSRSLSSNSNSQSILYPDQRQQGNSNNNPSINSQTGTHAVQPIRPTYEDEQTTRKTREGGNNPSFITSQNSRPENNYNTDNIYYPTNDDRKVGSSSSRPSVTNTGSQTNGRDRNPGSNNNLRPTNNNNNRENREYDYNSQTLRPSIQGNEKNDRDYDRDFPSNSNSNSNNNNNNRRPSTITTTPNYYSENTKKSSTSNYNYDDFGRQTTTQYPNRNNRDRSTSNYDDYGRQTTTPYPIRSNRQTTKNPGYFSGDLPFLTGESTTHSILSNDREEECGIVVPKTVPLIIQGEEAYDGQFPWHTALYLSSPGHLKYICGGSLLKLDLIVTSAHCVTHEKSKRSIDTENLLVYAGKYNLRKWTGPEQDGKVEEIIVHPEYDYERFYSDVAILKLKDSLTRTNYVRPVCLWNFDSDLKLIVEKLGTVPGFGYNEHGLVSEDLSFIRMPVVTHETCIWSNRDFFSKVTSDKSFCAGFKNGTSVCNGDSGGGMVFKQGNKFYLRGIVSVSVALQNTLRCDPNHFAVFADVAKFVDWIRSKMQ